MSLQDWRPVYGREASSGCHRDELLRRHPSRCPERPLQGAGWNVREANRRIQQARWGQWIKKPRALNWFHQEKSGKWHWPFSIFPPTLPDIKAFSLTLQTFEVSERLSWCQLTASFDVKIRIVLFSWKAESSWLQQNLTKNCPTGKKHCLLLALCNNCLLITAFYSELDSDFAKMILE